MRVRRAAHLVSYWRDGRLIVENYRRKVRVAATALTLPVLDASGDWQTIDSLRSAVPGVSRRQLSATVRAMIAAELLDDFEAPRSSDDGWRSWDPAAGLLHFSTKDLRYRDAAASRSALRARARRDPMPTLARGASPGSVALPPPDVEGEFPRVLRARRTWRRFAASAVPLASVSTLLGLSCAVQHWVDVPGVGRYALKTYPSGGAQHPLDVHLLARRVDGLAPGLYRYAADVHRLEPRRRGSTSRQIAKYLPSQDWYGRAAALLLITAVFPRTQWKYRDARAYKVLLAEAGHLCQNICLTATWLGLAPFCTMALADSKIEEDLGIDGVTEAVVYAAGVGARPEGVDWAPWPTPRRVKKLPGPVGC